MKFVIMSCLHYTESNPLMRKENYGDLILNKLKWILDYANGMEASILFLGDLYHSKHNVSIREINKLMEVIGDKIIYGICGNHDVISHQNFLDLETRPIGILVKAGKFRLIQNDEEVDFLNGVIVTGENYHLDYEVPETYNRTVKEARCHIHLTHGMLTEKPLPYNATHIGELDISCDFLFNGHNHKPFSDPEKGIHNVGSIARIAMDKNFLNKKPVICLLDTDTKKVEIIEVPIEKDVWVSEIKRDTLDVDEVEKFAESIKEMEIQDDEEMLKEILKDESKEVCEAVYNYLGE